MDYCQPIHASAFAHQGMGCLLLGASGTGKSRLLTEAMLHGAHLIADDRVRLCVLNGNLVASPVAELEGVVELRGFGLITCKDVAHSHPIHLVVELDDTADTRLPDKKTKELMGVAVPYLKVRPLPATSTAALLLYLRAMKDGRVLPADWRPEKT